VTGRGRGLDAIEVVLGETIQRALSAVVLDGVTAALFFLFGVLLVRSAPGRAETDGGVAEVTAPAVDAELDLLGRAVEGPVGRFLAIFAMMAAGEFGDRTQLVTTGLAVQYGATPAIWLGETLVIVPVGLANAYLFHRFAGRIDLRLAHYAGAALFSFFGADTVLALVTGVSVGETAVTWVAEVVASLV
jgi:putative Ca2+/H+ antiporter (TMEM165/GDT1 family)